MAEKINTSGDNPTAFGDDDSEASGLTPLGMTDGDNPTAFDDIDSSKVEFGVGHTIVGQFEVIRMLGEGGMGAVYEVQDLVTNQRMAIKAMLPSMLGSQTAKKRFVQEVNIARRMEHPNVVRVFDVRQQGGLLFYTMELVEGRTLRDYLNERRKLSVNDTVAILYEICSALEYAHQFTVHRDISPENVIIQDKGRLKLIDFGIAKALDETGMTASAVAMGKAYYMAPEQRGDAATVDARADIWSLGVMFFEMLTGQLPVGYSSVTSVDPKLPSACDDVFQSTVVELNKRAVNIREFRNLLRKCAPNARVPDVGTTHQSSGQAATGDMPATALGLILDFVADHHAEWSREDLLEFTVLIYQNPAHAGIARDMLDQAIETERGAWLAEEARQLEREQRRAEERRRALEEEEQRRQAAEDARQKAETERNATELRTNSRQLLAAGKFGAAIEGFEEILRLKPGDPIASDELKEARNAEADALGQEGEEAFDHEDYVRAIELWETLLERNPNSIIAERLETAKSRMNDEMVRDKKAARKTRTIIILVTGSVIGGIVGWVLIQIALVISPDQLLSGNAVKTILPMVGIAGMLLSLRLYEHGVGDFKESARQLSAAGCLLGVIFLVGINELLREMSDALSNSLGTYLGCIGGSALVGSLVSGTFRAVWLLYLDSKEFIELISDEFKKK